MSRWPLFAVSSMWLATGCAHREQVGLANAPWLGSTGFSDERPSDVIANGDDGCGRLVEWPPLDVGSLHCATEPRRRPGFRWAPTTAAPPARPLDVPWLQHFYVGWPCPHPASTRNRTLAWSPTAAGACEWR